MGCPGKVKFLPSADGFSLDFKQLVGIHEGEMTGHAFCNVAKDLSKNESLFSHQQGKFVVEYLKKELKNDQDNKDEQMETTEDILINNDKVCYALETLKQHNGTFGAVLYDREEKFRGLYFTTVEMQNSLKTWPEVIYIWTVHSWLKEDFTIVLVSIKDSNGMTDVVVVGVIEEDCNGAMKWFFEKLNSELSYSSINVKYIFGEKHLVETHLREIFPGTAAFVSLYYSLQLFQKIINSENFVITKKERELCMNYFTQMAYARSLEDYNQIYTSFWKSSPKSVVNYFDEDWAPNKSNWTAFNMLGGTLVDTATKCEALDDRIKLVISNGSDLSQFIIQFFKWLQIQKADQKIKATSNLLRKPSENSSHAKYLYFLTDYAYSFVSHQMNISRNVILLEKIEENIYILQENNTILIPATENNCECREWLSMMLPCRHIFAVRREKKINFFDEELCDIRWTKTYYLKHRLPEQEKLRPEKETINNSSSQDAALDSDSPTIHDHMKRAVVVTNQLVDLLSTQDGDCLESKINVLEEIVCLWSKGYEVQISKIEQKESPEIVEPKLIPNSSINVDFVETPKIAATNINSLEKSIIVMRKGSYKPSLNREENAKPKLSKVKQVNTRMTRKIIKFDLNQYGNRNVPLKFALKSKTDQIKMMLSWIIKKDGEISPSSTVLDISDIKTEANCIQHSILHESVDLELIKPCLSDKAFKHVKEAVNAKRENELWLCFICKTTLEDECILCASCLLWFHHKCVGLVNPQKRKSWFCTDCQNTTNL